METLRMLALLAALVSTLAGFSGCASLDLSHLGTDAPDLDKKDGVTLLAGSTIRFHSWPPASTTVEINGAYVEVPAYEGHDLQTFSLGIEIANSYGNTNGYSYYTFGFDEYGNIPLAIRPQITYFFHVTVIKDDGQRRAYFFSLKNGVVTFDPAGRAFQIPHP